MTGHAWSATKVLCSGKFEDKSVVLNVDIENLRDFKTGKATIAVEGREVASFDGADANINYLKLSFTVQNTRGESLEGKVTDLRGGVSMISLLSVPSYGINFRNFSITCVQL